MQHTHTHHLVSQPLYTPRHLLVSFVPLPQLPEVTATPRVQRPYTTASQQCSKLSCALLQAASRTSVCDGSGVKATAGDEADALPAQTLNHFGRVLPILVTVAEAAVLAAAPRVELAAVCERSSVVPPAGDGGDVLAL